LLQNDSPPQDKPRNIRLVMMRLVLAVFLTLSAAGAVAQPTKKSQMSQEERQRMREDMRDAYRERQQRPNQKARQMSPEERGKLRRDIEDANRSLKR
jgi:Ni/Co efflux regulator RcnB